MSSGLVRKILRPAYFVFQHCVQDDQELVHARDETNFGRFAFGFKPLVEGSNDRVETRGSQGRHEQGTAYRSSAAPNGAMAFESTAVTREGSQADQSRDLFAAKSAELWEFSDQCTAAHGPNARRRAENFLVFFPERIFPDETIEVLVRVIEFLFEIGDMSGDTFFDRFGGRGQAVFLSDDHVDDLSSACGQRSEFQGELVGERMRFGTDRLGVVSQNRGIDAIGFRQLTGGFGEVSDLARVSHDYRDLGTNQSGHDLTFKTTGGFQDDQVWLKLLEVLDQNLDAGFIVPHRQGLCGGTDTDIELSFRHIDADKDKRNFQQTILLHALDLLQSSSALQRMRAWVTQATVRAFAEQGRDDPCYKTVFTDRGAGGLSRPFRTNIFHTDTLK
jgi:hypothetical protein